MMRTVSRESTLNADAEWAPSKQRAAGYCFAAASLLLSPFWLDVFGRTGSAVDDLFIERTGSLVNRVAYLDFTTAMLVTLLVTVTLFGVYWVAVRILGAPVRMVVPLFSAVVLLLLANYLRITFLNLPAGTFLAWPQLAATVAAVAAAGYGLVRFPAAFCRLLNGAVLLGVPFGLVVLANAAVGFARTAPSDGNPFVFDRPLAASTAAVDRQLRPVLWVIFDEWDYRLSFEDRGADVEMRALDRLRMESFFARNAYPPGPDTAVSIPNLITGLPVTGSGPGSGQEYLLSVKGEEQPIPWREAPNLFAQARAAGASIAVLAHQFGPYCGSFHRWLQSCWEFGRWWQGEARTVLTEISYVLAYPIRYVPVLRGLVSRFFRPNANKFHADPYIDEFMLYQAAVEKVLRADRHHLVFLHYELPHSPFLYDRARNDFRDSIALSDDLLSVYQDNLELVDRTFARLRRILEETGLWDELTVILSSDHAFRHSLEDVASNARVPFMVRIPGETAGLEFAEAFDTRVSRDLILEIMRGRLISYRQIGEFIDSRRDATAAIAGPSNTAGNFVSR